nr:2-dehydropantoate 2-reductase [Paraglaciecola sp. G1-23]
MNIAILGYGAIGGLVASQCHKLGYTYQILLRTPEELTLEIQDIELQLNHIQPNTSLIDDPQPFDLLILPIKAYQILPALKSIKRNIKPYQTIVLLHNGMGCIEQVKQLLPDNPCIAATTSYGAYKPDANTIKQTGLGETHLGWINTSQSVQKAKIETILSNLLPPVFWHPDISLALWKKLTVNAVINPLTATLNIKNGELAKPNYANQIKDIITETHAVIQSLEYSISFDELSSLVKNVIDKTADNYSSMHQDIHHKRRTEIEFINGYIVNKANELGLQVPQNEKLLKQVQQLEMR